MIKSYWASPEEKGEIIEFIDYVFSKAHRPHDFATLLPKLYGENGDGAGHHFIVREDGKIAATVLCYPVTMMLGGQKLETIGVGSVSTHPGARGKGYMKLIMDAVDELAARTGADFAVLSGKRQRYEYFGYQYGGYQLSGRLMVHNAAHALAGVDAGAYALAPMEQAHVPQAMALLHRQPGYCERSEQAYLDILRSWNNEPFVLLKDGEAAGFVTLQAKNGACEVAELLLENEDELPAVMKLLSACYGEVDLTAAPWQKQRAAWLADVCEEFAITNNLSYKVYRADRVRQACAALDGSAGSLTFDGFALPLPLYVSPPDAV